jgi:hypothetical protein
VSLISAPGLLPEKNAFRKSNQSLRECGVHLYTFSKLIQLKRILTTDGTDDTDNGKEEDANGAN